MSRDYTGLNLPMVVENWKLAEALEMIRPYWGQIPGKIEQEFVDAYNGGTDWTVTKMDLDLLPDNLWEILKSHLG